MSQPQWQPGDLSPLITEFFEQDNLEQLATDIGVYLACPLLLLDDAFRVVAHFCPIGFTDPLFRDAVSQGAITYEASAVISNSSALSEEKADFVKLEGSSFRRPLRTADLYGRPARTPCLRGYGQPLGECPGGNLAAD